MFVWASNVIEGFEPEVVTGPRGAYGYIYCVLDKSSAARTVLYIGTTTNPQPDHYIIGRTTEPPKVHEEADGNTAKNHRIYPYPWAKPFKNGEIEPLVLFARVEPVEKERGKTPKVLEAIEGELAFKVRRETGKWPLKQYEIHFRDDFSEIVKDIVEEIAGWLIAAGVRDLERHNRK